MSKNNISNKIEKIKTNTTFDMPLLITVLILLGFGIVMVLSASAPSALAQYDDSYQYARTQSIAAIIGLIAMWFFSKFDYKKLKKAYKIIYVFSILMILSVLIPGLGVESNGARRWINIGFSVQPSEITKVRTNNSICRILFR